MDLVALFLLIVAAGLLVFVAPVLRVRESSPEAAHRSWVIQSLPSVIAVLWWKLSLADAPPDAPAMPPLGIAPALAFGLQLLATPLAMRPTTVSPAARGVYTVLSAIAAMGMVVLYAAVQMFLPPSGDRSKYAAHDGIRRACLAQNGATFQGPRADLEKFCDCAGRRVVAEVGLDAIRKAQARDADAVDVANVMMAVAAAQGSCAVEQFGQKQ